MSFSLKQFLTVCLDVCVHFLAYVKSENDLEEIAVFCMYVFFFLLFLCTFSSVFLSFCRDGLWLICDVNLGVRKEGKGVRGALAVYVKALHCLMLNTSFCTSCFRSLCMSVLWVGREQGVGSSCTVKW